MLATCSPVLPKGGAYAPPRGRNTMHQIVETNTSSTKKANARSNTTNTTRVVVIVELDEWHAEKILEEVGLLLLRSRLHID